MPTDVRGEVNPAKDCKTYVCFTTFKWTLTSLANFFLRVSVGWLSDTTFTNPNLLVED